MNTYYRVGYTYVDGSEGNVPLDTKAKAITHARAMSKSGAINPSTIRVVKYVTTTVPFRRRLN